MSLFSPKINVRTMAVFCRQMAQMYDAGIPVLNGLKLATESTPDRKLRRVVESMSVSISSGATLSQAVERERKYWPNVFIELVGAGELGGRLKPVFYHLADYHDRQVEMRLRVRNSMIYPCIQLTMLWCVVSLLWAIGLMQGKTGGAFLIRVLLEQYLWLQITAAAVAAIALCAAVVLARAGMWRWIWGAMKNFVWPVSRMGRALAVARFCQALGLLLGGGIDAKKAVERAARTADNPYVTASLMKALPRLEQGATLTEALRPCKYLDPRVHEMLHVGEESGTLPKSLAKVAEQLELEALAATDVVIKVGEVVLLLLVACILGYFIISFWVGYYDKVLQDLDV